MWQEIVELVTAKTFRKQLGRLFSHPIALLAIATVFATIAGVWLTNYYQERAWVRDKGFETFRQGYQEALRLVDELSEVMSRRVFGLNRVIWVAKGTGTGELDQVWDEYYQSVTEWNTKLLAYKGRLARAIEPAAAEALGHWEDAALTNTANDPQTIHGRFFIAHQRVRKLVDCVRERCPAETKAAAVQEAEQAVNVLSVEVEVFIQACTATIHEYARRS
jgi:hypothetical protein